MTPFISSESFKGNVSENVLRKKKKKKKKKKNETEFKSLMKIGQKEAKC